MKHPITLLLSLLPALSLLCACSGTPAPPATLKAALADKFLIGTALNKALITGRDTTGVRIVEEQFSTIVAEDCMKSVKLLKAPGKYDFTLADKFVEFGASRGLPMTGHVLIWHSQLPKWFCHDEKGALIAPELLRERMKEHIYTVAGRYKGRMLGWDVVNEAFEDDGSWRQTPFYEILGEEYVYLAFQYANEADPDAELYYNDYNEWYPGRRDAIVKLINGLRERGLRIDAVGMQGHIIIDSPPIEEFRKAIDVYAAAGVKIVITELEMSALPYPKENVGANISDTDAYNNTYDPYPDGLPEEVATRWNERMADFFRLFLEKSDKISRVTLWGISDRDSWKNDFPMPGRTDYPLLYDRDYQPKPVVETIIREANTIK